MINNLIFLNILKALTIVGPLLLVSCQSSKELVHLEGRTMGTHYNIKYYSMNNDRTLQPQVDLVLKSINQQMSTYIESSEISKLNDFNQLDWIKISPEFLHVTKYALKLAKQTEGQYDPTIGPLVNLWGFGPKGERKVPTEKKIQKALGVIGYDKILVREDGAEIKKKVAGAYLDLSSLAKGYGVDAVADLLLKAGIVDFMVEVGGEVKTHGKKKDGSLWSIGIESPNVGLKGDPYLKVVRLDNTSLATSGNYRNFFESKDKRYSHTIDSKTGRPVIHSLASVSVIDESCMKADALATALMTMGAQKGFLFAEQNNIAAYFVYGQDSQSGRVFVSKETKEFRTIFEE